jgi:preprotein translocase subunit YajC
MKFGIVNMASHATEWLNPIWIGFESCWVLAQAGEEQAVPDAGNAAAAPNGFVDFLANPVNLILISAILFMFMVARPQQKQLREKQKALSELKKNDRVVTTGGIHGVVVQTQVEEGLVTIRIDENSGARMTINRDSISTITSSDSKE